jgi:putative ABC transport system permease protein
MNDADIDASGLIGVGSRVRYALLIAGDEEAVARYNAEIEDELPRLAQASQRRRKQ